VSCSWKLDARYELSWHELFPPKEKLGTRLKIQGILVCAVPGNWTQDMNYLSVSYSPDKL